MAPPGRLREPLDAAGLLYRIATNVCLDALDHQDRRILPTAILSPADPHLPPDRDDVETPWLQPFPDVMLEPAMPPTPYWYQGRDRIGIYLRRLFASPLGGDLRLVPTGANWQRALAVYGPAVDGNGYQPFASKVLTVNGGLIAAITGFVYPGLFGRFALPPHLPHAAGGHDQRYRGESVVAS